MASRDRNMDGWMERHWKNKGRRNDSLMVCNNGWFIIAFLYFVRYWPFSEVHKILEVLISIPTVVTNRKQKIIKNYQYNYNQSLQRGVESALKMLIYFRKWAAPNCIRREEMSYCHHHAKNATTIFSTGTTDLVYVYHTKFNLNFLYVGTDS